MEVHLIVLDDEYVFIIKREIAHFLVRFITAGWEHVSTLPRNEAIIRLPEH